jgi:glycine cleavage system aminomethyltransferase T
VTSAGFGHTLGRGVAMGYVRDAGPVDQEYIDGGRFALDIAGERFTTRAGFAAPYDPRGLRIRS